MVVPMRLASRIRPGELTGGVACFIRQTYNIPANYGHGPPTQKQSGKVLMSARFWWCIAKINSHEHYISTSRGSHCRSPRKSQTAEYPDEYCHRRLRHQPGRLRPYG